jgi:formylglycine-generating enzyme required for sulfatase activity
MRSLHSAYKFAVLLLVALGACAPGSTPTAPGTGQPGTPSLVPAAIAGPPMQIGSTWLYADGTVLVAVPAGLFTMGGGKTDNPAHPVNLSDFWIYRTKVTNFQYAYCVEMGGCTSPSKTENPVYGDYLHANDPVVGVDHSQATDYCEFVHARLPTEAEWEKMARGTDARIYPWGEAEPSCDWLNYETCKGGTTPVNTYPQGQSPYHAFDAEGNTFEWVADWYKADYYASAPPDDPQGPDKGQARSVRSSAFNSGANQTQTFNRFYSRPADQRANLGFRCVVEDPTYFAPFCEYPAIYGTDEIGGAASDNQYQIDCPDLSIDQTPTCNGSSPVTLVTININHLPPGQHFSWIITGGGCIDMSSFKYTCTGNAQFKICSECFILATAPPRCPEGYAWDPNLKTCLGSASPGACLPGSTPDPTGLCCTFEAGPAAPTADPLSHGWTVNLLQSAGCPPGTWLFWNPDGASECVSVPVQSPFCVSANVSLLSCSGGGGPGGCPPPPGGCGTNYAWDPATCSCVCNGC